MGKPSLAAQLFFLFLPFVLIPSVLFCTYLWYGMPRVAELVSLGASAFFVVGKCIVLAPLIPIAGISDRITFSSWQIATMMAGLDTMAAFFMVYNIHLLNRLPYVGPKIKQIRKNCYYLQEANPWMKRFASAGIVIFVAFPLSITGSVSGSFLSMLLGHGRLYTVLLVWIGTLLGSFGMAVGVLYFRDTFEYYLSHPQVGYSLLIGILLFFAWTFWKLKKMIARQKKIEEQE